MFILSGRSLQLARKNFDDNRNERNADDTNHNELEVSFDPRKVSEKVSCTHANEDPGESSGNIVECVFFPVHAGDPCHKRRKGSDDRKESCEKNGFPSVAFVKTLGLDEMSAVQPSRVKIKSFGAKPKAYLVIDGISKNAGDNENKTAERE